MLKFSTWWCKHKWEEVNRTEEPSVLERLLGPEIKQIKHLDYLLDRNYGKSFIRVELKCSVCNLIKFVEG
jgi:hypothetical protein